MRAGGQRLRAGIAAAGHGLRPTKERPGRAAAVRWAAAGPRRIRAAGVFASGCAFPVAAQRAAASATALLPLCASSRALQSPAFVGGPSGASSSRSAAQQHLRCFVGPAGPPRYAARGRRSSLASPAPFMRHSGPPLVVGPPGARRPPGRGPRPPPQPGAPALLRWSGGRCPSAHGRSSRSPLVCGLPPLRSGCPCSLRAAAEPLCAWLAALALRGPLPRPFFRPGSAPGRPGARLRRAFTLGRPYAGGLLRGRPRCVSGASPTPFRPPPIRAGETRGHDRQRAGTGADAAAPILPHTVPGRSSARLNSDARGIQGAGASQVWGIPP